MIFSSLFGMASQSRENVAGMGWWDENGWRWDLDIEVASLREEERKDLDHLLDLLQII